MTRLELVKFESSDRFTALELILPQMSNGLKRFGICDLDPLHLAAHECWAGEVGGLKRCPSRQICGWPEAVGDFLHQFELQSVLLQEGGLESCSKSKTKVGRSSGRTLHTMPNWG